MAQALEPSTTQPPTLRGLPPLGVLPSMLRQGPYDYLRRVQREHGDLVKLHLGPMPIYLASSPELLQYILRDNHKNYPKPNLLYGQIRAILGNGLITSEGDLWLRQRRMIGPFLHRKHLQNLVDTMVSAIDSILDTWAEDADQGNIINIVPAMTRITMDVVTRCVLGGDTLTPEKVEEIGHHADIVVKYTGIRGYLPFLPSSVPIPGTRKFEKSLAIFKQAMWDLIADARERGVTNDLLSMMLHAVDEETNQTMSDQQLFDEVITTFSAGFETTATALPWAVVLLEQHPEIKQKMLHEIDTVLGDRTPTAADVMKLPYTRQVFQEAIRMYAPVPLMPRQAVEADELGGYHIPAKSYVVMYFDGVHHNVNAWDDPDTFDPDRFSPERRGQQHPYAYLAFSGGPRKCAGEEFAYTEAVITLARMFQRYHIELAPEQDIKPHFAITVHTGPVMMHITHR